MVAATETESADPESVVEFTYRGAKYTLGLDPDRARRFVREAEGFVTGPVSTRPADESSGPADA